MGTDPNARQPAAAAAADAHPSPPGRGPRIVAFDFDGTLTVRDSFTAFLRWRRGPLAYAWGVLRLAPSLLRYLGDRDRGRLKAQAVRAYLLGLPREALDAEARAFARTVPRFFRPDALAAWERHGAQGHRRVIVTASPEETVRPFAEALGADDLLGTRLAFDSEGRVCGAFAGENCRGAEKVVRLRARFGPDVRLRAAYGDTAGDREMLELADEPGYRVFTGRA